MNLQISRSDYIGLLAWYQIHIKEKVIFWYYLFMASTKLIVIRGPSGAGKSTVAKLLHARVSNKTALIEQDYYRHFMFNNLSSELEAPRHVMLASIQSALDHGYDVIVEGFLGMHKYKTYFDEILEEHKTDNTFFYLEVGFQETLRRHKTRNNDTQLSENKMKELYSLTGPTGYHGEIIIPELTSAEDACQLIVDTSGVPTISRN